MNVLRPIVTMLLAGCPSVAWAGWDGSGYYVVMTPDQEDTFLYSNRYDSQHFCKYNADELDRRARGELMFDCWYLDEQKFRYIRELSADDLKDIETNELKPK